MFCGAGSLPRADDDDDDEPTGPPTPKGPSKKSKPNPYSTRGLDKFSTVLAELGEKRERIMARTGSQGVAMVRFMYDNSKDWIPIVVRPKQPKKSLPEPTTSASTSAATKVEDVPAKKPVVEKKKKKKVSYSWGPSYYWPMVVVLILMCLVAFGRAFAICCTCMWWYMVPTFRDWSGNNKSLLIKKKNAVVKL